MSKPLNKIDIKDKVLEDVHVIDENKEDENWNNLDEIGFWTCQ